MTLRSLWLMAVARRRSLRQHALDIASCVGAAFGGKKVEWNDFVKNGELIVWDRYPLPMTPAIKAEVERLKEEERKRDGRQA